MASKLLGTPDVKLAQGDKTQDVAYYQLVAGGTNFLIEGICPAKFRQDRENLERGGEGFAEFLPTKVWQIEGEGKKKLLWSFGRLSDRPDAKAYLNDHVDAEGVPIEPVIIYSTGGHDDLLLDVIPIVDLPKILFSLDENGKPVRSGGRKMVPLIAMKFDIAERLNLKPVLLPLEKRFDDMQNAAAREATREASKREQEARDLAAAAKREERELRRQKLMRRTEVIAFTAEGNRRKGTPVTETATEREWESLPKGHPCILVTSYNDETKEVGAPVQYFIVKKRDGGGAPKKHEPVAVTAERPVGQSSATKVLRIAGVMMKDEPEQVTLVQDFAAVKALKAAGLNSGTFVGVPEDGKVHVYALAGDEIKDRGLHPEF